MATLDAAWASQAALSVLVSADEFAYSKISCCCCMLCPTGAPLQLCM